MSDIEPKNSREVDITRAAPKRLTVMLAGDSGSGKSYTAASFPRPRFLADAVEGGWDTVQAVAHEHPDWLYDENWLPQIRKIRTMRDMYEELELAEQDAKRPLTDPKRIFTLVIDSLTYYANACEAVFMKEAPKGPKGIPDGRQAYGQLKDHLRNVMLKAHSLADGSLNVVWTALVKESNDEKKMNGIYVSGQTGTMAPAACSLWLYQHAFLKEGEVRYEARTRMFGANMARGRFGDLLPDPIPNANYKEIEEALGMSPFPKFVTKPVTGTKPVAVINKR